jgi:colanic acid biosynthesis glycosyl transferase WcaI
MSHILFITYYYPPENGAAMVRISETAKRLVKLGHQVTVLTTLPNCPTGIVPPEYRGHMLQKEMRDGVRVIRVWNYINSNTTFLRRIIPHITFAFLAPLLGGKAVGQPDVIIVSSPPLFVAIAGRLLSRWKRCPFIFWVSDLWPGTPVELGILRSRLLIRFSEWLEWSTYKKARIVWAVTEGIRDNIIQRGLPPEQVFLLTNGVDTTMFHPLVKAEAREKLGWDDRFTVLYAGTHGVTHGLTTILEAAEQLQDHTNIHFIFAGDGAEKANLIARAKRSKLKNITFLGIQPHHKMPLLLAGADVCLVPLRRAPLFEGALPSKMYEIMACARPMLLGVNGEARRLTEQEAGAALFVEPENPSSLVASLLYMYEHPEIAELMGWRGRAFVEARFDRDQLVEVLEVRISTLLDKNVTNSAVAVPAVVGTGGERNHLN